MKIQNTFDSQAEITRKLTNLYYNQAIKGAFAIVGSIEILGNPVGLFRNIGDGVTDLFEKPIDGMVQGPL